MITLSTLLTQATYYYGNAGDYYYNNSASMYSGVTLIGFAILLLTMVLGGVVQMGLKPFPATPRNQPPSPGLMQPASCCARTGCTMCR